MIKILANETVVWLILVLVTLLAWGLVEGQTTNIAILTVVFLSSLKVLIIGFSYIEFLRANTFFKRFYPVWVVVVALMIVLFKLFES